MVYKHEEVYPQKSHDRNVEVSAWTCKSGAFFQLFLHNQNIPSKTAKPTEEPTNVSLLLWYYDKVKKQPTKKKKKEMTHFS